MKLRPFEIDNDFDIIKDWITDERTHAFWCANHTNFPREREDFSLLLKEIKEMFGDAPYVATSDEGEVEGFFCFGFNQEAKEAMLKFVMLDGSKRGKGLGKEMIKLAVNVMALGVTVLSTIGIIISGVMIVTARDNVGQVAAAKNRIYNIVIGLTLWGILAIGINLILPGGGEILHGLF